MFMRIFLSFTLLLSGWHTVSAAAYNPNWGTVGVFTDAQTCAGCHRASAIGDAPAVMRFADAQGEDISPHYQWRHSIMAHAFDDPFYQAVVEDEAALFSGLAGLVEDTCLTCHTPMAHVEAEFVPTEVTLFDDGSSPASIEGVAVDQVGPPTGMAGQAGQFHPLEPAADDGR